jgi:hypothetical protein
LLSRKALVVLAFSLKRIPIVIFIDGIVAIVVFAITHFR